MANGDLIKDLAAINAELRRLGASTREIDAIKRNFQGLTVNSEEFNEQVKIANSRINQLRTQADSVGTSFSTLLAIVKQNVEALETSNATISRTRTLQNKVVKITQDLKYDNEGIVDLNKRQLESKLQTLVTTQEELKQINLKNFQ